MGTSKCTASQVSMKQYVHQCTPIQCAADWYKNIIIDSKGYVERLFNSGLVRTNLSFGHGFDIFTHPLYEHKLHCGYAINFILLEKGKKDGKRQKTKQKQKLDHKNCSQECINRMFKEKRALRSVRGHYLPMFSRKVIELQVYKNC